MGLSVEDLSTYDSSPKLYWTYFGLYHELSVKNVFYQTAYIYEHLPGKYLLEGCTLGSMSVTGNDGVTDVRNDEITRATLANSAMVTSFRQCSRKLRAERRRNKSCTHDSITIYHRQHGVSIS